MNVKIYDPLLNFEDKNIKKNKSFIKSTKREKFDIIIFAVKHDYFLKNKERILKRNSNKSTFLVDLKNIFKNKNVNYSL